MATFTVTKSFKYANGTSGISYDVTTSKTGNANQAYQSDHDISTTEKDLFIISDNPSYANFKILHLENTGATDIVLRIKSTAGSYIKDLPAGGTWEAHSIDIWNSDSTSDPDTLGEIHAKTAAGTSTLKVLAFI